MSLSKTQFERQPTANPMRQTAADRLESVRARVRSALLAADEGQPTFATLDSISRSLVAATSDLGTLAVELETHTRHA